MCHKLPCTNHINLKKINEWHDGDNEMCMFFSVFSTSPCDTCHQSLTKFVFFYFNILFSNANTILIKSHNHQIWISSINTKTYSNPELKTFDFVNATINMSQHRSHKYYKNNSKCENMNFKTQTEVTPSAKLHHNYHMSLVSA